MGVGSSLKTLGMGTALSYGAARLTNNVPWLGYHRYRLLAVPRAGMPKMPGGYRALTLSARDLADHAIDVDNSVQAARFAQGMVCIGAFAGAALCGVNWLTTGSFDEDEVRVRYVLPPGAAWDTGLWIPPERRMSRAFAALWAGSAAWLADHDLNWSVSRIADYNLSSLNSHRRMQAVDIKRLLALRVGNMQIILGATPCVARADHGAMPCVKVPELT